MDEDVYSPLVEFDTTNPEFARGFEAGRLWAVLRAAPDDVVQEYVSAQNAEMMLRLAEATNRPVQSEEIGDGWLIVTFLGQGREPLES